MRSSIEGNKVIVSCNAVPRPTAMRHDRADSSDGDLKDDSRLPAGPFRNGLLAGHHGGPAIVRFAWNLVVNPCKSVPEKGLPDEGSIPLCPGQQGVPLHQEWLPPKSSAQISVTKAVGS